MDGKVVIGTELDTKNFEVQIKQTEQYLNKLVASYEKASNMSGKMKPNEQAMANLGLEIEKTNNKLIGLYQQQAKVNNQSFSGMKQSIDGIGSSISNITKKAVKWGLAIFGVRSMYLGIRQAVSQIMQEDEGLKGQIDYMKFAVGQAIKPVVEWIVNLVHQILVWLGAIIKILFGINIFSNATASNFKKANSNAKQLKKTLTGFDEMNILNEDGSTSGLGAGYFKDIGNIAEEVDKLADKLKPFEEEIKGLAWTVAGIFGASIIAKWIGNIGGFLGSSQLGKLGSTLLKLGVIAGGIIITGIIAKKVWDELGELTEEIKKISKIGHEAQKDYIENQTDINQLLRDGNANRTAGYKQLEDSNSILAKIRGTDKELLEDAKKVSENLSLQINRELELLTIKVAENGETEETRQLREKIKNNIEEQIKYNIELVKKLHESGMETKGIADLNDDLIQSYIQMGGDVNALSTKLNGINNLQFDKKTITIDADTSQAESKLSQLGRTIANAGTNLSTRIHALLGAKGLMINSGSLPRLAVGGIINRPGRGVPVGIGGERGAEAVVPLTDSQQMELLGSTIGKYININLTNITELDGRQIARKVDKINQNNNFVLNR